MSKEMGHVIRVSQWERGHFFLREKRGYPPPIPPFFDPFLGEHVVRRGYLMNQRV